MSILLQRLLSTYQAPAGEDGADTGAAGDRGDSFTPTDGDAPEADETPELRAEADEAPADEPDLDPEDPDGEPKAEAGAAEDKPSKKKDSRIPLSRHKEILEREREQRQALEERLKQFEKGRQVADLNEDITKMEDVVLGLEKEYTKLLAEGELDKASAKMREIRSAERQINDAKNEFKLQTAIAQATERARYDTVLERIEEAYPEINPDHDDFDKGVLGEVVEWKLFYEKQRNLTPSKALQQAVKKVLGQEGRAQERATDVTPKVDAKDVAAERKKAAVTKTLAATGKTPPSTAKVGLDSDKAGGGLTAKDIMKMSQEDFRKLPDDVLARMRGDVVA